jgi:hydrogenase assembly chaperone HypC/HupF
LCFALPARVLRVAGQEAEVDTGYGKIRKVVVGVTEPIRKGDYVLLYAGMALEKIDRQTALESLQSMRLLAMGSAEKAQEDRETKKMFDERFRRLSGSAGR